MVEIPRSNTATGKETLRQPLLFGSYELTIDDKNRLLIPSAVRKQIIPEEHGEALFVAPGSNGLPWLYPERYYEQLITQVPLEMLPGEDLTAFNQWYFALADRIEWDKQGRVLIPDQQIRQFKIGKEVTLIGARDHLELWNRADWNVRRQELERRGTQLAEVARRTRVMTPVTTPV